MKAPKLYLRDTGLLHHLLNIDRLETLENHPIRGASWETFVLEDLLRREAIAYPHGQPHFWRTASGAEVDLLLARRAARRRGENRPRRLALSGARTEGDSGRHRRYQRDDHRLGQRRGTAGGRN